MALRLAHLPLDKMDGILADDTLKLIFLNENIRISIQISLKFVPNGPIDDKSALVQVMAWRRPGGKPFPEAMLTQFTDAYLRHYGEMSYVSMCVYINRLWYPTAFALILEWFPHRICEWSFKIFSTNILGKWEIACANRVAVTTYF